MAKVVPTETDKAFQDDCSKFKKVFGTEINDYAPEYLAARTRVGEYFFKCPSGANLCYFKDGEDGGVPMYCFHGGGEGKYMFLHKEPIPGVLQIAIDRHGYGHSTGAQRGLDWDTHIITDILALADSLGHKKFVVSGFSIGSSWAKQIAASPDGSQRVIGCMLWGSMCDTYQPDFPKEVTKKVGRPPSCLNPKSGCCGCILRKAFAKGAVDNFGYRQGKNDLKYAFEREAKLPCWEEFKADKFWVNTKIDSLTLGFNSIDCEKGLPLLEDASRTLCSKWQFREQDIKCRVMLTHGAGDYDMSTKAPMSPDQQAENMKIKGTDDYDLVQGCGHVCIYGPIPRVVNKIEKFCAAVKGLM